MSEVPGTLARRGDVGVEPVAPGQGVRAGRVRRVGHDGDRPDALGPQRSWRRRSSDSAVSSPNGSAMTWARRMPSATSSSLPACASEVMSPGRKPPTVMTGRRPRRRTARGRGPAGWRAPGRARPGTGRRRGRRWRRWGCGRRPRPAHDVGDGGRRAARAASRGAGPRRRGQAAADLATMAPLRADRAPFQQDGRRGHGRIVPCAEAPAAHATRSRSRRESAAVADARGSCVRDRALGGRSPRMRTWPVGCARRTWRSCASGCPIDAGHRRGRHPAHGRRRLAQGALPVPRRAVAELPRDPGARALLLLRLRRGRRRRRLPDEARPPHVHRGRREARRPGRRHAALRGRRAAPDRSGPNRTRLVAANRAAAEFFARRWRPPEAAVGRHVPGGAGFDAEALRGSGSGYAPRSGTGCSGTCARAGFTDAELIAAGLVVPGAARHVRPVPRPAGVADPRRRRRRPRVRRPPAARRRRRPEVPEHPRDRALQEVARALRARPGAA